MFTARPGSSPTALRILLGAQLQQLREAKGLTCAAAENRSMLPRTTARPPRRCGVAEGVPSVAPATVLRRPACPLATSPRATSGTPDGPALTYIESRSRRLFGARGTATSMTSSADRPAGAEDHRFCAVTPPKVPPCSSPILGCRISCWHFREDSVGDQRRNLPLVGLAARTM